MTKFQVGDRVRCLRPDGSRLSRGRAGQIVTVSAVDGDGYFQADELRGQRLLSPNRFELERAANLPPSKTAVELTTLRKGDKVTIVLTLSADGVDEDGDVYAEGHYITGTKVVAVERAPRPIQAGDQVSALHPFLRDKRPATVLFVDLNTAWVKFANGTTRLTSVADLDRE